MIEDIKMVKVLDVESGKDMDNDTSPIEKIIIKT